MGQNQSHLEGGEVVVIDETLRILASRKCTNNPVAGHSRPLSPPRSREVVIAELRTLCSPKVTPPADDTTGSTGTKRPIEAVDADQSPDSPQVHAGAGTPPTENNALDVETQVQTATKPSDDLQSAKKKKRLFVNEQAVKAAQEISEQSIKREDESIGLGLTASEGQEGVQAGGVMEIDSTDPTDWQVEETKSSHAVKRHGPFVDDDSQDEGYYTYSPSSAETSFNEDDGDELVQQLAKIHQRSYASRPDLVEPQIPTRPDSPTRRKLQEEDESAEQSRRLREQKLSGQAVKQDKHKNLTASSSFLDDDLILSDGDNLETTAHHTSLSDSNEAKHPNNNRFASDRYRSDGSASRLPAYSNRYHARVDSPESEDSELDHHLDVAQSYKTQTPLPKPRLRKINPRTPSYRRFPTRSNPYSRQAAERYRTQDRRINTAATTEQPQDRTPKGSIQGEDRLRALTGKPPETGSVPRTLPSFGRSPSPVRHENRKFHAIDLGSQRSRAASAYRPPQVSAVDSVEPENRPERSPPESETLSSTDVAGSGDESPARPLSMLELMARKAELRDKPASVRVSQHNGPSLDLGVSADIDFGNEDEVRVEHERLKEQQKDLIAIESTCLAISRIRALGPLNALEIKEENEVSKYISIVLDGQRSGKDRRSRMTAIRGNFDRRLDRENVEPTEQAIQQKYLALLGEKHVKQLNDLRDPLDDIINQLRSKRSTLVERRHSQKHKGKSHKKRVRFSDTVVDRNTGRIKRDLADGTVIDFDEPHQKKKIRPLGKEAKEIAMLEEKLKLVRAQAASVNRTDTTADLPTRAQDSESEVSVEDSEAEYVSGTRRDPSANSSFTASTSFPAQDHRQQLEADQDLEEINRLENQRQEQDGTSAAARSSYATVAPHVLQRGTQRPDAGLIERMMATKYGNIKSKARNAEDHPFDDVAETSDSDVSVASAASSSMSSSSYDRPHTVSTFKYTVVGQFVGIEIYNQELDYVLKTFHNLDRANAFVQQVMTSLATNYPAVAGNNWELMTRCRKGIYQQVLALGEQELIQASVWIERKEVEIDTGKMNSRKARKALLGEARGTWVVDWEKTVTTTVTVEAAAAPDKTNDAPTTNGLTNEEEDDLFGRSPSPPPATPTTTEQVIVTRPTPDEFLTNMFTTATLANRRAKELYISWYAQYFPEKQRPYYGQMQPASGSRYEGMLGQIDMALEEELERLGEWNMGCWEEEVASEGGTEREKMRVWVRRVGVLGPQN